MEGCDTKRLVVIYFSVQVNTYFLGNADQKGKVMGIFRSLGALARAIGPVVSCTGKQSVLIGSPLGLLTKLLCHLILYIN